MKGISIRETTEVLNFDLTSNSLNYFNSSKILNFDDAYNSLNFFNSSEILNFETNDFDGSYPEFKVVLDFYIYTLGDIF